MRAGISLGSNLGDRTAHLDLAVREVTALAPPGSEVRVSTFHETEPVDCPPGSGAFLNAAMEIEWPGNALDLLHKLQRIEASHGRPKIRATNAPRPLDLDLLYHGDTVLETPELTLPHPKITVREFVLRPIVEISPALILPKSQNTVAQILNMISTY